jgi:hypothetical protein
MVLWPNVWSIRLAVACVRSIGAGGGVFDEYRQWLATPLTSLKSVFSGRTVLNARYAFHHSFGGASVYWLG